MVSNEGFPFSDVHDLFMTIIHMFGPERCVWGSGFPTEFWVEKAGVSEVLDVFVHQLPLDDAARSQVLGETAARLWFPHLARFHRSVGLGHNSQFGEIHKSLAEAVNFDSNVFDSGRRRPESS